MARTNIAIQTLAAYDGFLQPIVYTAADATNDMKITHPGGDGVFLLVWNDHATADTEVTLVGVANARTYYKVTNTVSTTGDGEFSLIPLPLANYDQGDGLIHVDIDVSVDVYVVVFKMHPTV